MFVVYTFDYDTGIYTGIRTLDITDADPRAPGVISMPGNTTTVPPPRCGRGSVSRLERRAMECLSARAGF